MKRPRSHVMEETSVDLLRSMLPKEWIARKVEKDYGVDFEIEIVDGEIVTGKRIWVQLKSTEKCCIHSSTYPVTGSLASEFPDVFPNCEVRAEYISFVMETHSIEYALKCSFPLLLFVADLGSNEIYWLPIRDEVHQCLANRKSNWMGQRTNTLRIPVRNSLSCERSQNYASLQWFALEPARAYAMNLMMTLYDDFKHNAWLERWRLHDEYTVEGHRDMLLFDLKQMLEYMDALLSLELLFGSNPLPISVPAGSFKSWCSIRERLLSMRMQVAGVLDLAGMGKKDSLELKIFLELMLDSINRLTEFTLCSLPRFRCNFLHNEANAVWHASKIIHQRDGILPFPQSGVGIVGGF